MTLRITELLNRAASGDAAAEAAVFPALYEDLKRIAQARRARGPAGETLRTTALVHEAYLRLKGKEGLSFEARSHYLSTAARAMRDILVEGARRHRSKKRGGDLHQITLDEIGIAVGTSPDDMLALDAALRKIEKEHPDLYEIVMLRYFAGLTHEEIAETLQVGTRTIERIWRFGRAYLRRELG